MAWLGKSTRQVGWRRAILELRGITIQTKWEPLQALLKSDPCLGNVYIYMCVCLCLCVYVYIYMMLIFMYLRVYVYMCICVDVYIYICIYVCVLCICVYDYVLCLCFWSCVYVYIHVLCLWWVHWVVGWSVWTFVVTQCPALPGGASAWSFGRSTRVGHA